MRVCQSELFFNYIFVGLRELGFCLDSQSTGVVEFIATSGVEVQGGVISGNSESRQKLFAEGTGQWPWLWKQLLHRAHREEEPPLNLWEFEKSVLPVKRQSRGVFRINDDAGRSHFPAVQQGSVERVH